MMNIVTTQGIQFMQPVTVFMQGFLIPGFFQFDPQYLDFFFQLLYSFKCTECYFENTLIGIKTQQVLVQVTNTGTTASFHGTF